MAPAAGTSKILWLRPFSAGHFSYGADHGLGYFIIWIECQRLFGFLPRRVERDDLRLQVLHLLVEVLPGVGREDVKAAVRKHLAGGGARLAVVTGNARSFAAAFGADAVRSAPAGSFFKTAGWPGR